jgi:hypothetical protein
MEMSLKFNSLNASIFGGISCLTLSIAFYTGIVLFILSLQVSLLDIAAKAETESGIPPQKLFQFLKEDMKFSEEELSTIKQGKLITKLIDGDSTDEISYLSITRIDIPKAFFLKHYGKDVSPVETFSVLKMGRFGNPPKLTEIQGLRLDSKDVQALKDCKVGKCDMKISSKMMERFRSEIDWSQPDCDESANKLFQQMLFAYIQGYLSRGNAALIKYDDQSQPVSLSEEFNDILEECPYMFEDSPEFYKYLETFPNGKPSGVKSYIYWAKEDIGANYNVVSLNHIILLIPDDPTLSPTIVSKQVYADHYYEASLRLTTAVENPENATSSMYLVHLDRSKIDALRRNGFLNGTIRSRIQKGLIKSMNQRMKAIKEKLEALYQAETR